MSKNVEFLGMLYSFDDLDVYDFIEPPTGYKMAGYNDVNVLLCESIDTGELYMQQPETGRLLFMAPSVEKFIELATKFKFIDVQLSDDEYLQKVNVLLDNCDNRLANDFFWGSIIEEIENGVL